ncbi:MAG: hypothetical protein NWF05_06845 [Candidatus Bathyarchaeota archaeon]|nr:hypothetical protein [Candidatus Bathyarchaeota archaeon]
MSKTVIEVMTIAALLFMLAELQFVEMAEANWVPFPGEPITDQPTITVYSPASDSTYNNEINLNFSVVRPDSWVHLTPEGWRINAGWIDKVTYALDENQTVLYTEHMKNIGDELPKSLDYSLVLGNLSVGTHVVTVTANFTVNYYIGGYLGYLTTNRTSTSQSRSFTVAQMQTPSASSFSPLTPSSLPPSLSDNQPFLSGTNLILLFFVIVVSAAVVLTAVIHWVQ